MYFFTYISVYFVFCVNVAKAKTTAPRSFNCDFRQRVMKKIF